MSKVLIVCGLKYYPDYKGGVERAAVHTIEYLKYSFDDVVVISRGDKNIKYSINKVKVHKVRYFDHKYLSYISYMYRSLFQIIEYSNKSTIIHLHNPVVHGLWVPLLRFLGYKTVIHSHGLEWRARKWPRWFSLFMKVSAYIGSKYSSATICVSKEEKRWYQKYTNDNIYLIPNGISKAIHDRTNICEELELRKKKYWLFVGRFVPQKNIIELIDAYGDYNSDYDLVLVGDSSHTSHYKSAIISKSKENKRIKITGWLSPIDVHTLMSECYGFILPSVHEGCPNVLLEAISCGAACIVSDIIPHKEIGGNHLYYFNSKNTKELSSVLRKLEQNNKHINEIKKSVIYLKSKLLTWSDVSKKLMMVYLEIFKPNN